MKIIKLFLCSYFLFWNEAAISADPSFATISRCFFVYAPIFETAKKIQNRPVFIYGQKRIAWAGGYFQAQQKNTAFTSEFDKSLTTNKAAGARLEERLTRAIQARDVREYQAVMNIAAECDSKLGLPTNDIPPP